MKKIVVDLIISRDEYLRWYQGSAKAVATRTVDGRSVRFPVNILQPYVTHSGISGRFAIAFNDEGKFMAIEKISGLSIKS
ncbi:MAG: DUF2835 domain-containing protein [Pseudomonadales bacterium]|nr:DUF2835 domain-containing protein [Pseudomonadales bacterium]